MNPCSHRILTAALFLLVSGIVASKAGAQVPFGEELISGSAAGAFSVSSADVDGDGDLDVLSASFLDDKVAWYENDGNLPPSWTEHVISLNAQDAVSVFGADVDQDGDMDVLSASCADDKLAWYENDGALPPNWTEHVISIAHDCPFAVLAADLDRDGDTDVLAAIFEDDRILFFENDGAPLPSWTTHVVSAGANGAIAVHAVDIDADGDLDVLSASDLDARVTWYENDGASPPSWTTHDVSIATPRPQSVFAADVNGDGAMDVLAVSASDKEVLWFESDGARPPAWTPHSISTTANGGRTVEAADVDGDGDMDVVVAAENADKIAWYENGGVGSSIWIEHELTTTADGAYSVHVADLDADGDVDILSAAWLDDAITWFFNESVYMTPSGNQLSATTGGLVTYQLDFPSGAAGDSFQVLISTHGTGPMRLGSLAVPLSLDKIVIQSLQNRLPSFAVGFAGTLDAEGDAFAYFVPGPGQLRSKLAGRTIQLAAVTRPLTGSWRYCSQAVPLTFLP